MTDNERKWIHPTALAVLDGIDKQTLVDALDSWEETGRPLLTDEAKAVLEAVEQEMKRCDRCRLDKYGCIVYNGEPCEMGKIRQAWKCREPK